MGIVVIGAVFVDIKGFPEDIYIPDGRNVGRIEYIHGGVSRNVAENIANVELRPTFLSLIDESAMGEAVVTKLKKHKVNTDYILTVPNGMGTWLAVFDNTGNLAGSISKRIDMTPILKVLEVHGDEIFSKADSVIVQSDLDKEIMKKVFSLSEKYHKKTFAVVSNIAITMERRDFLQKFDCFVCNQLEAGMLFAENLEDKTPEELCEILPQKVASAKIPSMVVTMGEQGAVYVEKDGASGICPAQKVIVKDTTGAGDAFCSGVAIGLTYGKKLKEAVRIGTRLAASVITSSENVCPRFMPEEFEIDVEIMR